MCSEDLYVAMLLLYMLLITDFRSLKMCLDFFSPLEGSRELWIFNLDFDDVG